MAKLATTIDQLKLGLKLYMVVPSICVSVTPFKSQFRFEFQFQFKFQFKFWVEVKNVRVAENLQRTMAAGTRGRRGPK